MNARLVRFFQSSSLPSKMPTRSKAQALLPFFCGQMFEAIGIFWPIFQPNWSASCLPTIMPVRVLANACHWASGITHSG